MTYSESNLHGVMRHLEVDHRLPGAAAYFVVVASGVVTNRYSRCLYHTEIRDFGVFLLNIQQTCWFVVRSCLLWDGSECVDLLESPRTVPRWTFTSALRVFT